MYQDRSKHDTEEGDMDTENVARELFNRSNPARDYDTDAGEAERELYRRDARELERLTEQWQKASPPPRGGRRLLKSEGGFDEDDALEELLAFLQKHGLQYTKWDPRTDARS